MPQELGLPRYLTDDIEAGTKIVTAGEYGGFTVSPKYNNKQHSFHEIGGDHVILSGGQLDWRLDQGDLREGNVYDVTFDGRTKLEKGKWSGSEAKQYSLALYSAKEVAALLDSTGSELRGPAAPAIAEDAPALPPMAEASSDQSLEDLA